MDTLPSLKYFHKNKSDTLNVLLHGGGFDIESDFMKKLFDLSKEKGRSVLSFNFPYIDRGEDSASNGLIEESRALEAVLDLVRYELYTKIHLIGKSLGAIVAGRFLKYSSLDPEKYSITVLGYVLDDIDIKDFEGKITIIQGSEDRFGNILKVKEDMEDAKSLLIKYYEIEGADHSFRDPKGEYKYVDKAFEKIEF